MLLYIIQNAAKRKKNIKQETISNIHAIRIGD